MTVVQRLVLPLGMALAALFVEGGYGLYQLDSSIRRVDGLETHTIPKLKLISMSMDDVADMHLGVYRFVGGFDVTSRGSIKEQIEDADRRFDLRLNDFQSNRFSDTDDLRMLDAARGHVAAFRDARRRLFESFELGEKDRALAMLHDDGTVHTAAVALAAGLREHFYYNIMLSRTISAENAATFQTAFSLMLAIIVGALLLTCVLGANFSRLIREGRGQVQETRGRRGSFAGRSTSGASR